MKSFGLFLNVITTNRAEIEKRISFLGNMENLGHVEVWLEHTYWSEDDSRWLKEKLKKYEVLVHAPFINLSFVTAHEQINIASLNELKRTCDHTRILGGKVMTLHAGRRPFYISDVKARKIAVPYLQNLLDYVGGEFELAIENLPASSGTSFGYPVTLDEFEKMAMEVPRLNVTVDIGHCLQNNDAYEPFFEKYPTKISDIHVHNGFKKGTAHFGFGQPGDLNLREFVLYLEKVGYANYFTFEILGDGDIEDSWRRLQEIIKEQ